MKIIVLSISIMLSGISLLESFAQQSDPKELELLCALQLRSDDNKRFDLSGIVQAKGKTYVIADKDWNNFIYEIKLNSKYWFIKDKELLNFVAPLDFEGIDYCDGRFLITDETTNDVYWVKDGKKKKIPADYQNFGENPTTWPRNAGFEGVAIDCENGVIYLAKERDPRYILEVNLDTEDIYHKWTIDEEESNDFTDLKFENGFLYILERNGNYIAKVDTKTRKLVDKVTYKQICRSPKGKLYEPADYGMAEALLLTKDEIWIGIDNNGLTVSEHAKKKYGMKGNQPVILKFRRPIDF